MSNNLKVKPKEDPLLNHIYPREYWDDAALTNPYNAILNEYNEKEFWDKEVDIDKINNNSIFLDLGCGIGRVAKQISPKIKEYHGVDFSPEMIKKAKDIFKDYKNVYFQVNNGIDLRIFEDDKFDVVYVHLVFQHMQKEITLNYIREVHRVLKKGGIFYVHCIPRIEKYISGFTRKEISEAIKPFKILDKKESEFYYNCKLKKIM